MRSYVLTYNFNLMGAGDAFGAYYLTPLLFSLLVLVTELAVVHQARRLQTALMIAAPLLVVCSVPLGDNYIYLRFLWMLTASVGSPVWLAVAGLAGFYAVAWLRKLPLAEGGLMAMLALLTMVGRGTIDRQTLEPFQWYPWCAIGAIQLCACLRHRSSFRAAFAAVCFVVTASIAWRDTSFVLLHGAIPLHLLVILWLLIGLVFRDRFAVVLRRAGLALTVAAAVGTAATLESSWFPPASRCAYLAALAVAAWAYWWATRDRWWFCAGLLHAGSLTAVGLWFSYQGLHSRFGPGALIPLSWGAACFLIGVLISALKGGLGTKLRQRLIKVGLMAP